MSSRGTKAKTKSSSLVVLSFSFSLAAVIPEMKIDGMEVGVDGKIEISSRSRVMARGMSLHLLALSKQIGLPRHSDTANSGYIIWRKLAESDPTGGEAKRHKWGFHSRYIFPPRKQADFIGSRKSKAKTSLSVICESLAFASLRQRPREQRINWLAIKFPNGKIKIN